MKSFPNDTVHNHPGDDQEHQEVPLNSSNLLNPSTDMKHLIAIKYLYDQISWRTVAYLPPELFHSSLTIRLTNIMHGGRGLIERNPTVRVPTFLRSPGAICKYEGKTTCKILLFHSLLPLLQSLQGRLGRSVKVLKR